MAEKAPVKLQAVIRWKNGDRQFIDVELVNGRPRHEILWFVGDKDGGNHKRGDEVSLHLLSLNGSTAGGRLIYVEWS